MNIVDGLIFVMPKSAILGRKNCTRCTRWRYLGDFGYERRQNRLYVKSQCLACEHERRRVWYTRMTPVERARSNRRNYVRRVETLSDQEARRRMDAWPVRRFLLGRLGAGDSVEVLAFRFDIDPGLVRDLARGYREDSGGLRPIRTVSANLLTHFQSRIDE